MKSLYAIGSIALMCSGVLTACETESSDCVTLSSETMSLPNLLSHVQNTTRQLIDADDETSSLIYNELKETLMIVYALNCLHPEEDAAIRQALDESCDALAGAIDVVPFKADILEQGLALFASDHDYEQEIGSNESISDGLRALIETSDAGLVYIQEASHHRLPPFLYSTNCFRYSIPKVLIIRRNKQGFTILPVKSRDDRDNSRRDRDDNDRTGGRSIEGRATMHFGGDDGPRYDFSIKGEVHDNKGNYADASADYNFHSGEGDVSVGGGNKTEGNKSR